MAESETNREVLQQVEEATDSETAMGEGLRESAQLKQQYRTVQELLGPKDVSTR